MADILPKPTPGRVEIDPTAVDDAIPGATAWSPAGQRSGAAATSSFAVAASSLPELRMKSDLARRIMK